MEQLACDTGPDGAGSERSPVFTRLLPGARVRAEPGRARPRPRCKVLPGKGGMGKRRRRRRRGFVGGRQKLDRLASLQIGREKKGRSSRTPPEPCSQRGLSPWRPPGSLTRRAQLREGPEELTYFGAEVAALGPAEGGERGAEREQGEQEAAGGSRGGRHGPRRRGAGRCGLRGGAHALGSRRRSPWAPLSSEGTELGFLERRRLGGDGMAPESACLLFSFPFFDLSSA